MVQTDCVVVGAGPAGLATSRALAIQGIEHVVLEAGRVGEVWLTQRWDAFRLNTPGWMNGVLGEVEPDGFLTAVEVADRLGALAGDLPVQTANPVRSLRRNGAGFVLETPDRTVHSRAVVVASGGQNVPRIPSISGALADGLREVHTGDYRSADQLPEGAVLVVGSGQSGCQIAEELALAGRQVYLCTSRVGRFPWSYRGRSCMSWLAAAGFFSQRREDLPDPAVARMPVPTVASGGRSLSLQSLARSGVTLLGRPQSVRGRTMTFDGTAAANVAFADQFVTTLRGLMDTVIERAGVEAPAAEPDDFGGSVDIPEVAALDLDAARVRSIVWCTGFTGDFSWIDLPVLDESGQPRHLHGATDDPGLWFVGLPWLTTRSSAVFFGMPVDAERIAGEVRTHLEARG